MSGRLALADIVAARATIAGDVLRTPAVMSPALTALLGGPVALKLELLQRSGCFKPRGIVNRIRSLSEAARARGIVTVSGGNHGIAMAEIAQAMGLKARIVMPEAAPERSKARIRARGAELVLVPDIGTAFATAEAAQAEGLTYVHAFDDPLIMAGHGTLGLEFIEDVPELTDVLVSIGGGALISGVATAIKGVKPEVRIWGVETEGADAMSRALAAGAPVEMTVTSIATTLGAPYVTARTLDHVKALVEEVFVIPDREAVAALLTLAEEAKLWAEPAAACTLAAAREVRRRVGAEAVIGLVICGGNVTFDLVRGWTERFGPGS